MRWTAPHKASRCRRVIVADESPERAAHENNYHARPCKEGVPSARRGCRGQGRRRPEAQTQGGVGVHPRSTGVESLVMMMGIVRVALWATVVTTSFPDTIK